MSNGEFPKEEFFVNQGSDESAPTPGTKWMKFWTYFCLPMNIFFCVMLIFTEPSTFLIQVPMICLLSAVIYGLHHRKLWGWKWNWVVIGLGYVGGVLGNTGRMAIREPEAAIVYFWFSAILLGVLWLLPNHIYWKKRRQFFK